MRKPPFKFDWPDFQKALIVGLVLWGVNYAVTRLVTTVDKNTAAVDSMRMAMLTFNYQFTVHRQETNNQIEEIKTAQSDNDKRTDDNSKAIVELKQRFGILEKKVGIKQKKQ